MPFIAAYGSLRNGMYNRNRFTMQFQFQTSLYGYRLYDLGPYPAVMPSINPSNSIVVDIFHVDEKTKQAIDAMEIGAGYYIDNVYITEKLSADLYLFDKIPLDATYIVDGDYVKYINSNKTQATNETTRKQAPAVFEDKE